MILPSLFLKRRDRVYIDTQHCLFLIGEGSHAMGLQIINSLSFITSTSHVRMRWISPPFCQSETLPPTPMGVRSCQASDNTIYRTRRPGSRALAFQLLTRICLCVYLSCVFIFKEITSSPHSPDSTMETTLKNFVLFCVCV